MTVRVLVVDDSAVVRALFSRELSRDPEIEVVGSAVDAFDARDKIVRLRPDVVTLDIEMPRLDGLTFLRKLMRYCPVPVIVVSSVTERGSERAVEALEAGGVDVMCKPTAEIRLPELSVQLADKIKAAARARIDPVPAAKRPAELSVSMRGRRERVVAVGASTGGPRAIRVILAEMPADGPPIVVVQHMPPHFTSCFAARLDRCCRMEVKEAENGENVEVGKVLIAPGNRHMLVRRSVRGCIVELKGGPLVRRQRPSVDVLFRSVAQSVGAASIGVILTGMGDDGAEGMVELHRAGAVTIAQDEESSTVHGMPREAVLRGGARIVAPLEEIASHIARHVQVEETAPREAGGR